MKTLALMKFLARIAVDLGLGQHVYVVGGAVRDFLLERPIKDVDVVIDSVACGMTSATFAGLITAQVSGSTLVTNNYGVAILTLGGADFEGVDITGETVEIANARKESYGGVEGKGYKPHMVEPATILEDVVRREFRFNTLLWRMSDLLNGPEGAEVIDLTGEGRDDLSLGRMICPAAPTKVFTDDPTRMLRAIKFALRYDGMSLGVEETWAIQENASALANVPQNAVAVILMNNIFDVDVCGGLDWLRHLGLLPVIKEMLEADAVFKTTLTNWARTRVSDMLHLVIYGGLPLSGGLSGLLRGPRVGEATEGIYDLQEAVATFECDPQYPVKALAFVEAIRQPGRVMDTKAIAAKRGLKGRQIRELMTEGRELLLKNPSLFEGGLNEAMGL